MGPVATGHSALADAHREGTVAHSAAAPGARVLDGRFTTVRQAIGVRPENAAAAAFLETFVRAARADGTVQHFIDRHGVTGRLQVGADG